MKELLNHLFAHNTLSKEQAKTILKEIGEGKHSPMQIASFLTVFCMRSITVEELSGFREAMLEMLIPVDLSAYNAIDIVGTGGDGKDTFNISTTSSFVVAGAGYKVAKHGNYGVSSSVGSSNVLEYLGIEFTNDGKKLQASIEKSGFCMMHAQLFHPAMKYAAPVRKEMQVRTFFNMLGPMINPSFPKQQLLGVYSLELQRLYGYLYQSTDTNYTIIHALDGYDEVSLTCPAKVIYNKGEAMLEPKNFGFKQVTQQALWGGANVEESAKILINILKGEGTEAQTTTVLANAALAIKTIEQNWSLLDCVAKAKESIDSGKAFASLNALVNINS